jgi:hypothetical protein
VDVLVVLVLVVRVGMLRSGSAEWGTKDEEDTEAEA